MLENLKRDYLYVFPLPVKKHWKSIDTIFFMNVRINLKLKCWKHLSKSLKCSGSFVIRNL